MLHHSKGGCLGFEGCDFSLTYSLLSLLNHDDLHNMVAAAVPAKRAADTTQDVEMENAPTSAENNIDALLTGSAKKTRLLFGNTYGQAAMDETNRWGDRLLPLYWYWPYECFSFSSQRIKLTSKIHDEYDSVRTLPEVLIKQQKEAQKARQQKKTTIEEVTEEEGGSSAVKQLIDTIPEKKTTATYDREKGSMTRVYGIDGISL